MLSKTKGVISKCLGKQNSKIELEQIKPYVNFHLQILLEHLYILNQLLPSTVLFEEEIRL